MISYATYNDVGLTGWIAILCFGLAINFVFVGLILSNINLRFSDPAMTAAQVLASSCWGLSLLYYLPDERGFGLMLFVPAFTFGAFRFNRKQYITLALIIICILVAFLILEKLFIRPDANLLYNLIMILVFSIALLWVAILGSQLYELQKSLRRQNAALKETQAQLAAKTLALDNAANTDYLTGIMNRRALFPALDDPSIQFFTVMLLDIDHFKKLNDQYGHAAGDFALIQLVERVNGIIRQEDIFVRWGGEEFLLLLPNQSLAQGVAIAERINAAIQQTPVTIDALTIHMTASIGVTHSSLHTGVEEAINAADQLLYEAKEQGRNRVAGAPA